MKQQFSCNVILFDVLCSKLLFNYVMKKIFDRIIEWASLGDGDEKNTSDDDNTSDHSDEFDVADEDEKNSDQQTASPRLKVSVKYLLVLACLNNWQAGITCLLLNNSYVH